MDKTPLKLPENIAKLVDAGRPFSHQPHDVLTRFMAALTLAKLSRLITYYAQSLEPHLLLLSQVD